MKSYLKFLSRNKLYTLIEAVGLSVSLGFVMVLAFYALTEYRVGNVRPEDHEIYTIGTTGSYGMTKGTAREFFPSVPEIEAYTRFFAESWREADLVYDGGNYQGIACCADTNFFTFFNYEVYGLPRERALASRDGVLLSRSLAARMFGGDDPIGKVIIYNSDRYTVEGLVDDFGATDVFKPCDIWFNFDVFAASLPEMDSFGNAQTFIRLRQGADPEQVRAKLLEQYMAYWDFFAADDSDGAFIAGSTLTRYDRMYLDDTMDASWGPFRQGNPSRIRILGVLALVLLISAVFNYINLTVAQVGRRAPEMAVRKLHGESSRGIRLRYLTESLTFTFTCGIIGILMALAAKPIIENILNTHIIFTLSPAVIAGIIAILLTVSLICAMIPSLIASGFAPLEVIKGEFRLRGKQVFSKVFIVLQCVMSTCLLALSVTMYLQLNHMKSLPKGYESEGLIHIISYPIGLNNQQAYRQAILACPEVVDAGYCNNTPAHCGLNGVQDEENPDVNAWIHNVAVDTTAFRLLGFRIVQQFTDPLSQMWYIDRNAATRFGVTGDRQWFGRSQADPQYTCCGIVENFRCNDAVSWPQKNSYNGILIIGPDSFVIGLLVKVQGDHAKALAAISDASKEFCRELMGIPMELEMEYIDDTLDDALADTRRTMWLVNTFMLVALIISALGILAMSVYYTGQQSRNIALRKVFGSDRLDAAWSLSRGMILLSVLAGGVATPICIILMRRYLQTFFYVIPFPWYVILLAIIITVLVTMITISANTYAAASRNPVNVLKKNE